MTKKRRYSLTEEDAGTAIFSLRFSLAAMQDESINQHDPYTSWRRAQMETLLNKLTNYKWEV